jgi:Arc/MetJ-type ribon-helix-helix transcriptional regulator
MRRTQIQLPEAEYQELREAASRFRRSMADCIREGIRLFLGRSRSAEIDLESIAGKFRPLRTSGLKLHDRRLAEAILNSKGRGKRK